MTTRAKCKAETKDGNRCKNPTWKGTDYCYVHRHLAAQEGQDIRANPWERLKGLWQTTLRRYWLLAAMLTLIGAIFAFAEIYNALTGRPALDLIRDLVPQRPFTTPAAKDEYLIIVTQFKDESEARNLDVRTVLAEGIKEELPADLNARVAIGHNVTPADEAEARAIGERHRATSILWGRYTDNLIEVNFTPLVELDTPTQTQERQIISQNVDELAVFINDLADGPVRWLSLLTVGQASYRAGRSEEAISYFNVALDLLGTMEPNKCQVAATYFYRGTAYARKEEYDRAIADFDQAIELQPDVAGAYYNRGNAYYYKGEYDRAIADYDQAVELQPDFAMAYYSRGNAYADTGDYDRAITNYDQAIELQPDYAGAYTTRGIAYHYKGEYDRAIADYDQAIELQPDVAGAYSNRGNAYYYKGEYDRAIADYDQAIEIQPNFAMAYYNRGTAYADIGDYEQAITYYDQAIELQPDYAGAYYNRGNAYYYKGEYDRAIADYDQAVELQPDEGEAYYNRGAAYYAKGEYDKTIEDFRKVVEVSDNPAMRQYAEERLRELGASP